MATLSKLELEDSSECIFVLSEFKRGSLSLKAFDGARGWEGFISEAQLQALARKSKTDFSQYMTETKKAFSRQELGDLSFQYSVKNLEKKDKILLVWKRYIACDNVKFQLGEVELSRSDGGLASSLLDVAVTSLEELLMRKHQLQNKCERLTEERREVLREVKQCANIQDRTEKDLFNKFKLVLNEKKAKIRNLMESVKHLQEENGEMRRKVWAKAAASGQADKSSSESKDLVPEGTSTISESTATQAPEGTSTISESTATQGDTKFPHNLDNSNRGVTHISGRAVASGNSSGGETVDGSSGGVISLLEDIHYRAPSPPPAKRRCNRRSHKAVTQLERPLAKPRAHSASSSPPIEKDLESDELLDQL